MSKAEVIALVNEKAAEIVAAIESISGDNSEELEAVKAELEFTKALLTAANEKLAAADALFKQGDELI